MARKWAGIAIVIFGLGLFFFVIRWLQINPFGFARRYWLWLTLLSLVVLVGYAIWDYKTHYPALKAQYDEQQRRQVVLARQRPERRQRGRPGESLCWRIHRATATAGQETASRLTFHRNLSKRKRSAINSRTVFTYSGGTGRAPSVDRQLSGFPPLVCSGGASPRHPRRSA